MRSRTLAGRWNGLVVIRAGAFFHNSRLADQHVAEHMAGRGVPVLYVDPPVSFLSPRNDPRLAEALQGPPLRQIAPLLARLTPRVLPGKSRGGLIHVTDVLVRRQLTRACEILGGDVRAVLSVSARPGFGICGERKRVFWVRDDFAAGADLMNLPRDRVERDERRMARSADLVVAVSPHLVDKWKALGCEAVLIPNGCDAAGLTAVDVAPLPDDVGLPPPVLGVVGTLGERIDFTLLRALADHGYSLLLVGSRQKNFPLERIADLLDRPNVRWVGPRPYAALPSYLRLIDVGLVPYRDSAFNRASFPLKTLEYLAAGRAVVSTELPAVRWLDTELIRVASDVNGFCASVHEAVAEDQTSELLARRRAFAMQHDWSHRVDDLLAALG